MGTMEGQRGASESPLAAQTRSFGWAAAPIGRIDTPHPIRSHGGEKKTSNNNKIVEVDAWAAADSD